MAVIGRKWADASPAGLGVVVYGPVSPGMAVRRILPILLCLAFSIQASNRLVTLALLGDVMLGRGVAQAASWEKSLAPLGPYLAGADLALANLESPITTAPLVREAYDLRADPHSLVALTAVGLDLLSLANNHALDCGLQGVKDTQAALRMAGLTPIGPDPSPVWKRVNGDSGLLAFLAFEDVIAPMDVSAAARAVAAARATGAQVIVSIHWGEECRPGPQPRQSEIAQALADAGAILIWGHHPHVLQPMEWIHGKGQAHPTLVLYSLGNALFDQHTPPDARRGAVALVRIDQAGVQSVQAIPFWIESGQGRVKLASQNDYEIVHRRLGIGEE